MYHRDRFDQENRQKNFIRKGEKRLEANGKIPGAERIGGSGIMAIWCVGEQDLLLDLKMMIKQYYVTTVTYFYGHFSNVRLGALIDIKFYINVRQSLHEATAV